MQLLMVLYYCALFVLCGGNWCNFALVWDFSCVLRDGAVSPFMWIYKKSASFLASTFFYCFNALTVALKSMALNR